MADGLKRARAAARATRTPAQPKQPTPQDISALLRKAGFQRAAPDNGNQGFHVHKHPATGEVTVNYWGSSLSVLQQRRTERETLARYAEAIRAAGWHIDERQNLDYLIVIAPRKEG